MAQKSVPKRSKDWTPKDDKDSLAQGWSIFYCNDLERDQEIVNGKVYGPRPFELCKYDELDTFKRDQEAWVFVWQNAKKGDRLAKRALRFLRRHSLKEFRDVKSYCETIE